LVHNHPSGDELPSTEDQLIASNLQQTGKILKIPVKDFVIIGKNWFSFFERECGEFD